MIRLRAGQASLKAARLVRSRELSRLALVLKINTPPTRCASEAYRSVAQVVEPSSHIVHLGTEITVKRDLDDEQHVRFSPMGSRILEPIEKDVESQESVVIRYAVRALEGGTTCGQQNIAGWRHARVCGIPAT